ncbi:MAG: outer membrane beta-barrel protein [candidate division Zixibacteria bacterium]|nr:outer membrane beta-barrel protein [candidate division Zixibacteria bacterium]MDD5427302.1 outer membrane beta-barrel protein [candidate division Zixibacteria bacterium]
MKKCILILFVLMAFAVACKAQGVQPFSLYVGGAVSVPTSPDGFKETYKTGYHGSIGAGYKFAPNFQLVGKAEYHQFAYDFESESGIDGGENKLLMFGADGRFSLNVPAFPVKPFIFGGAGIANIKFSEFSGSNTSLVTSMNEYIPEDQNKLYFNVGGGGEFKMSPALSFFIQGRYVNVKTEGDAYVFIPVTLGIKFF